MMEIMKYMKSEIASLKRKQEVLQLANTPRLSKFRRMLDLTNNDMESECLTSEYTSKIETSPEIRSHIKKGKSERVQKNPLRKSIPTSRNQEESEGSSDEDYRPKDDVLNTYASQTDGYDSQYESTVDPAINQNINECNFSKISCVETESDLEKPANADFQKIINLLINKK